MAKAKTPAKAKPSKKATGGKPAMLGDDVKATTIKATLKKRNARKDPIPGFTVKDKIKAREAK